jgi:hypothetical protein
MWGPDPHSRNHEILSRIKTFISNLLSSRMVVFFDIFISNLLLYHMVIFLIYRIRFIRNYWRT